MLSSFKTAAAALARAAAVCILLLPALNTQAMDLRQAALAVNEQVLRWRHDIHQHPELGNRETRTAAIVADHLRALGFDEVQTGVAHTGVVGTLKGAKPGPVVALRADMDALPVTEATGLPYASTVTTEYRGQQVGVMHACGHDAHTAILMGVAQVLAEMRDELPGTVKFIFQPAEEGAPEGEEGGAKLMLKEGVFTSGAKPEAIYGLHVAPFPAGMIGYRAKGAMAASDSFEIVVKGKQTHGSMPWTGVDPVVVAGQIASALQLIPARQLDITNAPAVISVGAINGGIRHNIIPSEVTLIGTIRTFDSAMQDDLHQRLRNTAEHLASASGATAEVLINRGYPVTYNDPALTAKAVPVLKSLVASEQAVVEMPPAMGAEDFSYYQKEIPGLMFMLGVNPEGVPMGAAAPNHSPHFMVNDDALKLGVEALAALAVNYLKTNQ
ncbi:amidohydrolase [Parahaliea sp. F7430]|uniref:Amidohydrolase n=1 Tax=Sediminihaliea albiluteola TaxID=2758564 RepID=A0A7W2YJN4_9GAMM|nr:amidohydrolase [Sediminihaliea albiluteola]MBA6413315.1 amidohydrolase [Sediminihaliea albiluteola]